MSTLWQEKVLSTRLFGKHVFCSDSAVCTSGKDKRPSEAQSWWSNLVSA